MQIRIAGLVNDSYVDGEGIRYTIFTQGCPHHCVGCHNPATWDENSGRDADTDEILSEILQNTLLTGVTFSGGEPFLQPAPLAALAKEIHAHGLDLWCYTGFRYEDLLARAADDADTAALLVAVDVLVDGAFRMEERDLTLAFRGSKNQRILDLRKTRETGTLRLWEG